MSLQGVSEFEQRKVDHIKHALSESTQALGQSGLDAYTLIHEAIPDLGLSEVDIRTHSFGKPLKTPFFICGMTAGHAKAPVINKILAQACERRGWVMGLGSQRRDLEASLNDIATVDHWHTFRASYPNLVLIGNLGLSQIIQSSTADVRRIADLVSANSIAIHANPLQEAIQPEGTPNFNGGFKALSRLCDELGTPIVLKETGSGLSKSTLKRVSHLKLAAVDVSGLGGTHWGRVEGARAASGSKHVKASKVFENWGVPTAVSIQAAAVHYLMSGKSHGKKALVIASDIARYGRGTPGEPTQGAGAVAMLVSDKPNLVELDSQIEGFFSKQVMDFWRPVYSKEAFADGHYSINCYLEALSESYKGYQESLAENKVYAPKSGAFSQNFIAQLYHVPFVKMAQKAHQKILEVDRGAPFEKDSPELESFKKDFYARVSPYLDLNSKVGNIYTGALFLSLINFLENQGKLGVGKRFSLFSYGSGCAAEFMSGVVGEGASLLSDRFPYEKQLAERKKLSIEEYEKILDSCAKIDLNNESVCNTSQYGLVGSIVYLGTKDHKRIYDVDGKIAA
jgi:isopentenyl-diphosphate delta-isomerase